MTTPRPTADHTRLVLASASTGRLRLLRNAGFEPEVIVSGVDEDALVATLGPAPATATIALALARAKAAAVAERLGGAETGAGTAAARTLVVGCDSVLAFDGRTLGKPGSPAEAVRRWHDQRGRTGVLVSGHAVVDPATGAEHAATAETTVRFADPDDAELEAYAATGEPEAVAGAFTIDGYGGVFVEAVEGDWSNVVGLSLPLFRRLLARHGVRVTDLWHR